MHQTDCFPQSVSEISSLLHIPCPLYVLLDSSTPPISHLTKAACKPLPQSPPFPSRLPYCPLLLPDRPCPFLSVARSVDSVVEYWDTNNGKLSLWPAMLTLHSLFLGIHVSTIQLFMFLLHWISAFSSCFVPLSGVLNNTMIGKGADE